MIEIVFAAWLAVVGVLLLTPSSRRISWWGAVFVAPIAATALWILVGLAIVAMSLFSVALAVVLVSVVAVGISGPTVMRDKGVLIWLARSLGGAVGVAVVVAVVALQIPMVRISTDSFHYMMSAVALVRSGTLEGIADVFLVKRQLGTPLIHTLGVVTGRGYVSFWTPLLGVATFGTMTWLAIDGMRVFGVARKMQWAIVVPALVFILSTNRVLYHFFYINGHMLFAALLLTGVGLGWLAVRTETWPLLVSASLMFGALIPLRSESAMVVGAFLVVFVSSRAIPVRWRWALLAPTLIAVLLWDGWVLPRLLSSVSFESTKSPLSELAVAAGLVALVALGSIKSLDRFVRAAPLIVLGSLAVLLAGLVLRDPQILLDTIVGMFSAMTATGYWGVFWIVVPFLFLAAVIIGFPSDRYMTIGLIAFVLILPILAYLRGSAFGDHPGDSANRMVMHVVPLVMLVIMLAAGAAASELDGRDRDISEEFGVDGDLHVEPAGAEG